MAELIDIVKKETYILIGLRQGKSDKRFRFQNVDIEILRLIDEFGTLSLYQLQYYFKRTYGLSPYTLKNKLLRWREYQLVKHRSYTRPPTGMIYYQLDVNGWKILNHFQLARNKDFNTGVYAPDNSRDNNFDHFFCARDIALLTKISLKYSSIKVESVPTLYNDGHLVPDWILTNKRDDIVLYIEADMATERGGNIKRKIKKYIELAKNTPNKMFNVLFSVIDRSDSDLKYNRLLPSDRYIRVWNIKKFILEAGGHLIQNLNFYVVRMNRAGYIGGRILSGHYPHKEQNKLDVIEKSLEVIKHQYPNVKMLGPHELYLSDEQKRFYGDCHLSIRHDNHEKIVIVKIMEEGNVKDLDTLLFLGRLKREKRFRKPVERIIGIYRYKDELISDIIEQTSNSIQLACADEWYKAMFINELPYTYSRHNHQIVKEEKFI